MGKGLGKTFKSFQTAAKVRPPAMLSLLHTRCSPAPGRRPPSPAAPKEQTTKTGACGSLFYSCHHNSGLQEFEKELKDELKDDEEPKQLK